ncbi:MAG: mitochondrial small ribosomal subunit protein uS9m [Phycisphaerales bacterium]|nr:mitochondrial small ribosomal subunit protein uS9m [Phycisphaerales bacterium]
MRPAKGDAKVMIALDGDKTKTIDQYFAEDRDRANIYAPLRATGAMGKMDVIVRVNGGGFMGQAGAIVQGLARALKGYDPQMDAKKYGQAGARRRFQFSKR